MNSETSRIKSTSVTLTGGETWDDWLWVIRDMAERLKHWEYMDPSLATRPEPPEETEDLSTEDWKLYKMKTSASDRYHRNEAKMLDAIIESIDKVFLIYLRGPTINNNWDRTKALKEQVCPSKSTREQYCRDKYQGLLKARKRTNIDKWISQWQAVCQQAQELKLPEVHGDRAQYDFIAAVSNVDEDWARGKRQMMLDAPDNSPPTITYLVDNFCKARQKTQSQRNSQPGRAPHGAFATFQGKHHRPQNDKPTQPCVCGENHWFRECAYLNKAIRPKGWQPNKDVQGRIAETLRAKPRLKRHLERVNNTARRSQFRRKEAANGCKEPSSSAETYLDGDDSDVSDHIGVLHADTVPDENLHESVKPLPVASAPFPVRRGAPYR
ncbi:uncharacterized protein A1O5_01710 [Cladophialophora psammophila CBS 110553]|uniref:Uncharacterized protein n=1 Tax=Cladophialophora psammophila CBS 110553 TaxID=1182543 RepID=W9XXM5_9EURO|nr:uncharacterized protein A1O5_01710 [Cladophialophora psammophila CBS 110553]EXJ75014.1 hypothetical protein A1O5_01710 [Cladophialophora psammophila CBS 110553]